MPHPLCTCTPKVLYACGRDNYGRQETTNGHPRAHAQEIYRGYKIIDKLSQLSEQKYYALQPHKCNAGGILVECSALLSQPE